MLKRLGAFALSLVVVLVSSATLFGQKKDDKKQSDAQKREIQSAVKIVDDLAAGQPAVNDQGLAWVREDVLKAPDNKEYVPFTVTIDPSKVTAGNIILYWRVVAKTAEAAAEAAATIGQKVVLATGQRPAAATGQKKDDKNDDKNKKRIEYPYEDISFLSVTAVPSPMRISRSFAVPAGTYDVFVVVKEPTLPEKNAPAPKMSTLRQSVIVPDLWNGDLNTSSVIVTRRIDPLPAPLTPQQQIDRPYALGPNELVPAWDARFSKKSELQAFMLIYNPKTDNANKPDVTIEYSFYTKSGSTEKFFNRTSPLNWNAQTLPQRFDPTSGDWLQGGQVVPLASFPEGEYRLEIKVTDNLGNKSLTRDVNFTVTAS